MAAIDPTPAPTITARSAGSLVRRVRETVGIEPEALARRAGVDVELLARAEQPLDGELLDTLLLVLGHESIADLNGMPAAAPRPLGRYDAAQLAAAVSAPAGEQLERALEWNTFAAELAAAGPPDAPSDEE